MLANFLFLAGLLAMVAATQTVKLSSSSDILVWTLRVGVPACGAVAFLLSLRLSQTARQNATITIYSIVISLFIADASAVLVLPPAPTQREAFWRAWQEAGISGDRRTVTQVVRDLRKEQIAAYPKLNPSNALGSLGGRETHSEIVIDGVEIAPLSTVPNVISVFCNESGSYTLYTSDERGFNNSAGIWAMPRLDVAFIGDSYTEGACVPSQQNMVSRVREEIPATLNLGMAGNGPLLELATLSEYLPEKMPRVVVWEYTEGNDLVDLLREGRSPILRRYLEDGFTQGLVAKQRVLATALTHYADSALHNTERGHRKEESIGEFLADVLALKHLKAYAQPLLQLPEREATKSDNLQLFRTVAQKMNVRVSGWGGKLVFVYLPSPSRYDKFSRPWKVNPTLLSSRGTVLAIIGELGIPILDLDPVFQRSNDPLSYYASGIGHLNSDGYSAAAEAILEFLALVRPGLGGS